MLHVEFNAQNMLLVLLGAHFVNIFASWTFHFIQHQNIFGTAFHKIHFNAHHKMDSRPHGVMAPRIEFDLYLLLGYGTWMIFIITGMFLYHLTFSQWIAWTCIAEGLICGMFDYYMHREYSRPFSWLNRFEWFRQGRELHKIHHKHTGNFDKSRNYGFGGPLTGALVDKVFRTFEPIPLPVGMGHAAGRASR